MALIRRDLMTGSDVQTGHTADAGADTPTASFTVSVDPCSAARFDQFGEVVPDAPPPADADEPEP